MSFVALKMIHMACAFISGASFLARGILMIRQSPLLSAKFVKIAPHVNDTLLLGTAIAMLVMLSLNPLNVTWLMLKIGLLVVYIGLGLVALRFGKSIGIRIAAWNAGLVVFVAIVGIALINPA